MKYEFNIDLHVIWSKYLEPNRGFSFRGFSFTADVAHVLSTED